MRVQFAIFLVCLAVSAAAFAQSPNRGLRDVVGPKAAAPAPATEKKDADKKAPPPEPKIDPMTLLFKRVSQLMMVTFGGVNGPNDTDRQILRTTPPGAVIIPRITGPEAAANYVVGVHAASANAFEKLPILVGVDLFDQERFMDKVRVGIPLRVPTMLSLAAAGAGDASKGVFDMLATNVRTMGFDFHVGPSLALTPPTGIRGGSLLSFGSDPVLCSALGKQFGEAAQAHDVLWMPLGYPGGAGSPSMLLTPLSQLRNRDLLPYADAIGGGVKMINVGPSLVPTIDDTRPACFSSIVISDLRKNVFTYNGLVVAGPLDAPSIRIGRRPEKAAIEALLAGADMLYWGGSGPNVAKAAAAIVDAIQKHAIDEAIVDRALNRIRDFKKSLPAPQKDKDIISASEKLGKKEEKLSQPAALERRAITLAKNENAALPLTAAGAQPVGVIGVYGSVELKDALEKYLKKGKVAQRPLTLAREAGRIQDIEIARLIKMTGELHTVVFIVAANVDARSQTTFVRAFKNQGKRVVSILLGYPKNLPAVADSDAIVLAFGNTYQVGDTMKAVADVLAGNAPLEILPPLRPLSLKVGEATTFNAADVVRSPLGRLPVTFDPPFVAGFSVSYPPTLALETVRWDFGDGKKSNEASVAHAYDNPGDYVVKLSVGGRKTDAATGAFQVHVQ